MTNPKPPSVVLLNDNEENLCVPPRPRSPHPYAYTEYGHYQTSGDSPSGSHVENTPSTNNGSIKVSSESGTEADDESGSLFKGLPAPPMRPRKGLRGGRGKDEAISPLVTPRLLQDEKRSLSVEGRRDDKHQRAESDVEQRHLRENYTRRKKGEILRRAIEISLLSIVAILICSESEAQKVLQEWQQELLCHAILAMAICVSIPTRRSYLIYGQFPRISLSSLTSFHYPSSFDPAPYIYPVFLPLLLSVSLANFQPSLILTNSILGLCSLLQATGFQTPYTTSASYGNWFVTILPVVVSECLSENSVMVKPLALKISGPKSFNSEDLILLYPLHAVLVETLRFLTTTSLDPAEVQLQSTALINLLLFSISPQMVILKAILWVGGLFLFILCRNVLGWELALARVPTWRFRNPRKKSSKTISKRLTVGTVIDKLAKPFLFEPDASSESDSGRRDTRLGPQSQPTERSLNDLNNSAVAASGIQSLDLEPHSLDLEPHSQHSPIGTKAVHIDGMKHRRHTLSTAEHFLPSRFTSKWTTPSGRPKRSINPSTRSFLSLTAKEARVRRAFYAIYVYAVVACTVLFPVRLYIAKNALSGRDPFGWAMGYLLGQVRIFRFWIVKQNLDSRIPLPRRSTSYEFGPENGGWMDSVRLSIIGGANARLIIIGYWFTLLLTGLSLISRLSTVVEVDTRRKVFHGLIVAMILPVSFVDPCFTALALALVLAVFLLLDLLRASQVPPIARPLTTFLAPYVDGRDYRGPVIVSHIFLLIGCSIPLWLSLAGSERVGNDPWQGWETLTQDISMVSGVICVGMGDAAASLIGRRYGRHKWFWGGGKSIEGSLAFVAAVSTGLVCAKIWLRVGGWHLSQSTSLSISKIVIAASGASLTEAVLTGANDNVVVPLILWLLVRGLRI